MLSPLDSLSAILSDTLLWVLELLKLLSAVLPWQIPAWVATPLLVLILLVLTFALGSVAQSQLGNWMGRLIKQGLNAIPLLPHIYGSIRQLTITLLPATLDSDKAFQGTILAPLALGHTIALTQSSPAQFQGILPAGYTPAFIPSSPNVALGILCFCPPTPALPLSTDSALNTVIAHGLLPLKDTFSAYGRSLKPTAGT